MTDPDRWLVTAAQIVTCAGGPGPRRGPRMREIGVIEDGAALVAGDRVEAVGGREQLISENVDLPRIDFPEGVVAPGFVDSHTHAVFGGWRLDEYEQRCAGQSYSEIAEAGGGIKVSVRDLRRRGEDELADLARGRIRELVAHGTTTAEVKSGYGLTLEDELKMLRVVRRLNDEGWVDLVPTFLGAHAVPPEYGTRRDDYVELLTERMIPVVADSGLAVFCDVFMEPGAFTREETIRILEAAVSHGLVPKLHADELEYSGGAEVAVQAGAASADHLGAVSDAGIDALCRSATVATLLPGTLFFLGRTRYAPARRLIDGGAAVALATDFNPGSSPTVNLQVVMSVACSQMRMSPAEAIAAVTVNGAAALRLDDGRGSLESGAPADFAAFDVPDYRLLPYLYGTNHCVGVWKRGHRVQ